MKLIFLGPPGVGKGTQAKILAITLGIPHISTGDIFRDNIKNKTQLGIQAKELYDNGNLIPDDITNSMIEAKLKDCKSGYILDGYPRTLPQAKFLDTIQKIDSVINFTVSEQELMSRLTGRANEDNTRTDDNPSIVKHRMNVYSIQTEPLIEYYINKGILIHIDATPTIVEIAKKIENIIN